MTGRPSEGAPEQETFTDRPPARIVLTPGSASVAEVAVGAVEPRPRLRLRGFVAAREDRRKHRAAQGNRSGQSAITDRGHSFAEVRSTRFGRSERYDSGGAEIIPSRRTLARSSSGGQTPPGKVGHTHRDVDTGVTAPRELGSADTLAGADPGLRGRTVAARRVNKGGWCREQSSRGRRFGAGWPRRRTGRYCSDRAATRSLSPALRCDAR